MGNVLGKCQEHGLKSFESEIGDYLIDSSLGHRGLGEIFKVRSKITNVS